MTANTNAKLMTCPSPECQKEDVTDFSTCRHCGRKYDGSQERSVSALAAHMPAVADQKGVVKWLLVLLIVGGGVFFVARVGQTHRTVALDEIRQSIIATGRPRAIFIMKDWQTEGQPYVTTVDNESQKYGGAIDFCKLSSDDPANKEIFDSLGVQYTPVTAIFDRNGKESKTISGAISPADLDHYLANAIRVVKKP